MQGWLEVFWVQCPLRCWEAGTPDLLEFASCNGDSTDGKASLQTPCGAEQLTKHLDVVGRGQGRGGHLGDKDHMTITWEIQERPGHEHMYVCLCACVCT